MLRNSMLEGQRIKSSEYTLEPEWTKTFLWEYEWGVVLSFEKQRPKEQVPRVWGIQFKTVYRSPEFDSKLFPARWHYFGGLGIFVAVN